MVKSDSTHSKTARKSAAVPSAASAVPAPNVSIASDDHPLNAINHRLNSAHATLDLLFTIGVDGDGFETLCIGTLAAALHGAMMDIETAIEVVNREVAHG